MSREKELDYFVAEFGWGRGIAWYEQQFASAKVRGEASPRYTMYPLYAGIPERAARLVPDARLIYMVREPVSRTVSHYFHASVHASEDRSIGQALAIPTHNEYVLPSLYHTQLQQWLRFFPRDQFLVIAAEDLYRDRAATLQRVFRFLAVEESFSSPRFWLTHHRSDLQRQRTMLGQRAAPRVSKLLRRLPPEVRGYAEWLFFYPLSKRVSAPVLPPKVRRDLVHVLRPEIEAMIADWGVGATWLPELIQADANRGVE